MFAPDHPVEIERWDADGASFAVPIDASPTSVWQALTESSARARWWRPGVVLEAHRGGRFEEPWTNMAGEPELTRGEVLVAAPPQVLQLTWADAGWPAETLVEISLEPEGTGSVLYLSHDGFLPISEHLGDDVLGAHVIGWRRHLKRLKTFSERKEVPPNDDADH